MEVLSSSPDNYSFLDKDEVKKKVTFAAMAQSPSVDSVASIGSSISLNPGTNNNNNPDILLITPAHEVIFSSSPAGDLVAKLLIQNVSSKPVGYKIKTTSPDKYRVRPSTGILASNISTSVEIHCQQVWSSKYFCNRTKYFSLSLVHQLLHGGVQGQVPHLRRVLGHRGLEPAAVDRRAEEQQG